MSEENIKFKYEKIIVMDESPKHIISSLMHIMRINPNHEIKIIYSNGEYYKINLREDYSKIIIYEDFIELFTMNNNNIHEHYFQPFCGDCTRLIFNKDIKSIEY